MPVMQADPHQGENGYEVRSLYFDDVYDSMLNENEAGVDARCKYRIRIYNGQQEVIHLEKKSKLHGMTKKEAVSLTPEQCRAYMDGKNSMTLFREIGNSVEAEMYRKVMTQCLQPKCIVEYDRFALVEPIGNVRITFDRNIRGSRRVQDFFEERLSGVPVMKQGCHILEVKFDEFLPQYILRLLDMGALHRQSYSKYYTVRKKLG